MFTQSRDVGKNYLSFKKHVTATDYLYDNQRKEIYLMAKTN